MNFGHNSLFKFIGVFFLCFTTFYFLYKLEFVQKPIFGIIYSISNNLLSHVYNHTLVKVVPMRRENSHIYYEGVNLSINNPEYNTAFDSRIIMINEKVLKNQIDEARKFNNGSINFQMHSFKFSVWNFILLPFTIIFSFIIGHILVFRYSLKVSLLSIGIILASIIIQIFIILTNFRSQAINLEKFEFNSTLIQAFSKMHNLFHIEFTFSFVMIIYLLTHWKYIFEHKN
ncbi:MAG: hypothetical protein IT267_08175 [Saprospiraceae bacterium]|nr:hypothetical protein [Saprospiraceae bacterium]